jgi:hypothetical protein
MTRHRLFWVSAVVVVLLVGPVAVTLLSLLLHHVNEVAQELEEALVDGAAFATVYLTWRIFRQGRHYDDVQELARLADRLAELIRGQWEDEVILRQLNNPHPLPIRWVAADESLSHDWSALTELATSGAGWPPNQNRQLWANGPEQLSGSGNDLYEVLARVPTGRLLVLGEPGAGKTMLMVRLVLDLLKRREDGSPVPALVSLAAWDPRSKALHDWLPVQLASDLGLAGVGIPGLTGSALIKAMLSAGLIMPVLDGLDEIPDLDRARAISQINEAMRPGERLVVTCRTGQYRSATRLSKGPEPILIATATVELCPLDTEADADAVSKYLIRDAGSPTASARWAPVIGQLNSKIPVAQALTTPLMIGLARDIYNPRPGLETENYRDPAELCDPAFSDRQTVELHLFDAFVAAQYRSDARPRDRRKAAKAEKWLTFLACHLEVTIEGTDFAWWELQRSVSPLVPALLAGCVAGLAAALAAGLGTAVHGPGTALAAGFGAGTTYGLGIAAAMTFIISRHRSYRNASFNSLISGVTAGLGAGLGTGIAFGMSSAIQHGPVAGLKAGLVPALIYGIANAAAIGLVTVRGQAPGPSRTLRWRFSIRSLAAAVAAGLGAGILNGLPGGSVTGPVDGLIAAIATALAVGLATGLTGVQQDPARAAASPDAALRRDRGAAFTIMLCSGLGVGVLFALGYSPLVGLGVALTTGLAFGLAVSMPKTAWPTYGLTRGWLAAHRRLPWSLMTFMAEAHRRGILRRVGTVYQYRHAGLQHRLASRLRSWRVQLIFPIGLAGSVEAEVRKCLPGAKLPHIVSNRSKSMVIDYAGPWDKLATLPGNIDVFIMRRFSGWRLESLADCERVLQIAEAIKRARLIHMELPTTFRIEATGRMSSHVQPLAKRLEDITGLICDPRTGKLAIEVCRSARWRRQWCVRVCLCRDH